MYRRWSSPGGWLLGGLLCGDVSVGGVDASERGEDGGGVPVGVLAGEVAEEAGDGAGLGVDGVVVGVEDGTAVDGTEVDDGLAGGTGEEVEVAAGVFGGYVGFLWHFSPPCSSIQPSAFFWA
jgi:hypothetical protein